ncbi:hypothetical protein G7076_10090 [Sphingomonas sp. HDW15A]|uniref:hypothetical protein n=1 Tax=Sphingomonas sp. HDW15A TaxID=2714942 RepID=UPI00140DB6F5|nr:hypothetical protein [Sphingomonas sp. HDW15A]QIK96739.1 hypothetical protein G7076_10090 [Sphingomonas sp. HDW15A]
MISANMIAAAVMLATPFPEARPLVPFEVDGDVGCHWTMHNKSEKWIRGGIGQGDEDPILDLVDHAFDGRGWAIDIPIEVSTGDPKRRLPAKGWASPDDKDSPGSLAFYMGPELRAMIGGATSVQIWSEGKPIFNANLAKTPSKAELDACVRPPTDPKDTDEE